MLYFKTSAIKTEWRDLRLDKRLRFIIVAVVGYVSDVMEKDVVITSIFRPGDSGVHGCWRGIDLRSWLYTDQEIRKIVRFVNDHVPYNSGRRYKTCLHHNVGQGVHFHFQCSRGRCTRLCR